MESVKLSVLDVGLIRTNQSAVNAFSSMISLAQHAEQAIAAMRLRSVCMGRK